VKRREFIAGIGAATWPLVAGAQQADRVRRLGVLISATRDDTQARRQVAALQEGLRELGWIEGRNLYIETRLSADDPERLNAYAGELAALQPDALVASGPTPVLALRREAPTVPIIFAQVNDPVGSGLVATLPRPGGNVTGFTPSEFSIGGKMLQVLKDLAPGTTRFGVVLDNTLTDQTGMWRTLQVAAPAIGVQVQQLGVQSSEEIERGIAAFTGPDGGLIVFANRITINHRDRIISLAATHRLPAIYSYRYFVADGGLVSYGADLIGLYGRIASYVDRILKGAKPADLPVQQPTKYKLIINLKTAGELGLVNPQTLLATADEVIQ
jgi:putative tryptophan/tyrosine transport system substrate-binding protein